MGKEFGFDSNPCRCLSVVNNFAFTDFFPTRRLAEAKGAERLASAVDSYRKEEEGKTGNR
jgi:hypothetical protein